MEAINTQTVGQPLILQCSVTILKDINSRVEFIWIRNGMEFERIEIVGKATANNLLVYTHHYIISQLSNTDNNSLYSCKVVINASRPLSATGNITLNITGEFNVYF